TSAPSPPTTTDQLQRIDHLVVTSGQRGSASGAGQQHGGAGQQHGAQEDQVDGPGSRPPVEPVRVAGERDGLQQGEQEGPDGGGQRGPRAPLEQRAPGGPPQADQPGAGRLGQQRGQLPRPQRCRLLGRREQRHAEAKQDDRLYRQRGQQPAGQG